jgi:hypothetical protein
MHPRLIITTLELLQLGQDTPNPNALPVAYVVVASRLI